MLGLRNVLIPSLMFLGCGMALADDAQDYLREPAAAPSRPGWWPTLSVVGSLEGTYINNAFFTPNDTEDGFYFGPDIAIRLDGSLTDDISYRLYARGEVDAFVDLSDANNSISRLGARVSRPFGEWTGALIYEYRSSFGGIFEDRWFTAHDVMASLARDYDLGSVILSPGGLITYRHADVDEDKRYRMELWLGIEVPIDSKWSVVSEPFFESFWFTDGLNDGRRDQIYSVSLGLKYNLSDNASLTTEVVYEGRSSNQEGRDFDMIEVGPRLDFAF